MTAVNETTGATRPRPQHTARHADAAARLRACGLAIACGAMLAVGGPAFGGSGPAAGGRAPGASLAAPDMGARNAAADDAAAAPRRAVVPGVVMRVFDGDSMLVRLPGGEVRGVRIAGIDAPEKGQPHADASRRALLAQLHEREVRVEVLKTDRYDRLVGRVFVANRDAGLAQLRSGLAWHFVRYDADLAPAVRRRYASAEKQARLRGIGLWRDLAPLPPWEHRARMRAAARASVAVPPSH